MTKREESFMKRLAVGLFILSCAMLLFGIRASAAPVNSVERLYSQPTGQAFTATPYGDEFFDYTLTEDDYVIVPGPNDFWYYASVAACEEEGVAADKLQASGFRYKLDPVPPTALQLEDLSELEHLGYERTIYEREMRALSSNDEKSFLGQQPVLAIRVEFSDKSLTYDDQVWHQHLFAESQGSVRDYFDQATRPDPQSEGKIQIVPASQGDLLGGSDDAGVLCFQANCPYPRVPTRESLRDLLQQTIVPQLDAQHLVELSSYDEDGNGSIENDELHILFVLAGVSWNGDENQDADAIRAHRNIFNQAVFLSGKQLQSYCVVAEHDKDTDVIFEMGVICHELGHDLGLPDLYDEEKMVQTSSHPKSAGIGNYDLMGGGCWADTPDGSSPTHFSAYCKIQLGIVEPEELSLDETSHFVLRSADHAGGYNVLKIPTSNANEYFLVENRQPVGYDSGLLYNKNDNNRYSGGIAIYHVNTRYGRNLCYGRRLVDLEESNETETGKSPMDAPPGDGEIRRHDGLYYIGNSANNTRFGPDTQPSNALDTGNGYGPFTLQVLSGPSSAMTVKLTLEIENVSLDDGIYGFNRAYAAANEANMMAMQYSDLGESFITERSVIDNEQIWVVKKYGTGENAYNRIASLAFPGQYLSLDSGQYSIEPYADDGRQKWRFLKLGNDIYIQNEYYDYFIYIRHSTLSATDDLHQGAVRVTEKSAPVFERYSGYNNLAGNIRLSDTEQEYYLINDILNRPYITNAQQANPSVWYIGKPSGGYCQIMPADRPEICLTLSGNGQVVYAQTDSSRDDQKWCIMRINGQVQIRCKADLSKAIFFDPEKNGHFPSVRTVTPGEAARFAWRYTMMPDISQGGTFTLRHGPTNRVLDAANFGLTDGTPVLGGTLHGGTNQRWIIEAVDDNACVLYPEYNPNLYLYASGDGVVLMNKEDAGANALWKISTRGHTCRLQPVGNDDLFLTISGDYATLSSTADGFDWIAMDIGERDEVNTLPEGIYRFENVNSGLYLKGAGGPQAYVLSQEGSEQSKNNNHVWSVQLDDGYYHLHPLSDPKVCITYDEGLGRCVLLPYTGTDNQKWVSLRDKNEQSYRFQLKSRPGQVMVVQNASSAPNENIIIFGDNGTANGKWMAEASLPERVAPDQVALLSNLDSKLVMDAQNFGTLEGTRVLQWSKNYGENQRWIIKMGDDGYYQISPFYAPDLYLSVSSQGKVCLTGAGSAESAKWLFLAGDTANEGYYRLTPKSHPGKVAVVQYASQNQGEGIILYDDNGSHNGYWKPVDQDMELTGSMYQIRNRFTAYYLGADNDGNAQTASVIPGDYQHTIWAVYAGNGYYRFSAYNSGGSELAVSSDGYAIGYGGSGGDPDAALWFVDAEGRIHSKKYPDKVMVIENDQSGEDVAIVLAQVGTLESETWSFERLS